MNSKHVPPIDSVNQFYGPGAWKRAISKSWGSMVQFLAKRLLRFTPSRLSAIPEYVPGTEMIRGWKLGASIAPYVRTGTGRNMLKAKRKAIKKPSAWRIVLRLAGESAL